MRSDARANREAIVDAARRLFGAWGVDVSLSAIAGEAGTGIATLYRNFPTRDDLVEAVVVDLRDRIRAIEAEYSPMMDADPQRTWRDFVHALADLRPGALVPALAERFTASGAPSYVEPLQREVLEGQRGVLDRAKANGLVRSEVTPTLLQLAIAAITRPLSDASGRECTEHETWLVDVFLRGIRQEAEGGVTG